MKLIPFSEQELSGFRYKLTGWYRRESRKLPWRESKRPYHIWVSEVMLQQTQVRTVLPYFQDFILKFPAVADLAEAELQSVLKVWEGLGYYARARNMHKAARLIMNKNGGQIPESFEEFRKLPGVGEYIAAAVQSIAFDEPYAVVDGNVKRVLSRLFSIKAPVNETSSLGFFRDAAYILLDRKQPGDFNQAMMELGAMICRPQHPFCDQCPVQIYCSARAKNEQHLLPVRKKRKKTPEYHIAVGVVRKGNQLLITRRAENGLLGGLWEFPGGKVKKGESAEQTCIREIREEVALQVKIVRFISRVKHAYTHFKIVMDVFLCEYRSGEVALNGAEDFRWIQYREINDYPFPKANHKFIPLLADQFSAS